MDTFSCSLPPPCSSSSSVPRLVLPSLPVPAAAPPRSRRSRVARRPPAIVLSASRRDDAYGADSDGRLVDEDMIVLRKRLQEMRAAETNYEPPSHWMGWEKRYYASYAADVCHLVGLLQAFLMNARPSVALGLLVLVTLSVPTSAAVVAINLVDAGKALLGTALHLGALADGGIL